MGIINKFFSSVNGLYNNINPITLSGVNDVIVVRDESGEMRCSPFQLRFSRLDFYNSRAKTVQVYVNGILTDIAMTITSQGDLFFAQQRANDRVDYEKAVEYLQLDSVNIEAILSSRLTFGKEEDVKSSAADNCGMEPGTERIERVSRSMNDMPRIGDNAPVHRKVSSSVDDSCLCIGNQTNREDIQYRRARIENMNKRLFSRNNRVRYYDDIYANLALLHCKVANMLSSAEHYAGLLEKQRLLLYLLIQLIDNKTAPQCGASLSFSACLSFRIDRSMDETFATYLTKEIEDPDNTVVRIEAVLPEKRKVNQGEDHAADSWHSSARNSQAISRSRSGSMDSLITRMDAMPESTRTVRFYLPFKVFSKLFFELRQTKNKLGKLSEFLEKEHNRGLGWNLFGNKHPIKSDIGFTLELDSAELASLGLHEGKNDVIFKINGQQRQLEGNIFLWKSSDKIVVSDIDGTITKSDIRGHLYNLVGKDWTHNGVAALYSRIVANGYKIIYLTSRSLGQSFTTRAYIRTVAQDSYKLPDGPIIHSPDGLFGALYREVIIKKPEEFKIQCLSVIKELFKGTNPFLAGFGNRVSDAYTYKILGIPSNRIYTINKDGQLLAEYSKSLVGTYHTMNEFIDSIFPSIFIDNRLFNDHDFSDFSWWK